MTTQQLKALHQARPFRPFLVHLADGTSIPVKHPELMLVTQGGRTAFVNTEGDETSIFDLLLVTKLTYHDEEMKRPRRR
ncbi:MAG: hypothetical protein SGJ19_21130 [Planctomycetia bacterium]|nr:hypothetical protein [Planctomycetia bacterium]